MDVLALPVLAVVTVAFLIYIWAGWLSDPRKQALTITDDDGEDSPDQMS